MQGWFLMVCIMFLEFGFSSDSVVSIKSPKSCYTMRASLLEYFDYL